MHKKHLKRYKILTKNIVYYFVFSLFLNRFLDYFTTNEGERWGQYK